MKRVILSASALMLGGFVFAQTPQTVTKKAKQSQELESASKGSNFSQIDQMGIGSDATVQQKGTENASYIEQTGTSQRKRNEAFLLQKGGLITTAEENYADQTQNGMANYSNVIQLGDENDAWVNQQGNSNASNIQQGTFIFGRSDKNYAQVDQAGDKNDATINQIADNNIAISNQTSVDGARNGNTSYQSQLSTFAREGNTAISNQAGTNNEAVQVQINGFLQKGNYAEINQGDADNQDMASKSYAEQLQTGARNEAYINQRQKGNIAFQKQVGTDNVAIADQSKNGLTEDGNFVSQLQLGDDNRAVTNQFGDKNSSVQQQLGSDNVSLTIQSFTRMGNLAQSLQGGNNHDSYINQRSNGNKAMVDQLGTGHKSVINQNTGFTGGNFSTTGNNSATVKQRNGNISLSTSQEPLRNVRNMDRYQR